MSKQTDLDRRLTTALHEAADADRVWRLAMAHNAAAQDFDPAARRRLDALWQERERARIRVLELQWLAHSRSESLDSLTARLRSTKATIAVLGWHLGQRFGGRGVRQQA